MYFYKIYGIVIRSQIELPLLVPAQRGERVDAEIILGNIPRQVIKAIREKKDLGIGKNIIWFANRVGVFVITEGNRIRIHPKTGVRIEETHAFILGYCLAKMFWQRKMLAVHCSAVELFGGGLIISGYSGAGKSTLTTRFVNQGSGFIADDVAVVSREDDVNYIYPAFPYQKLCIDTIRRFGYGKEDLIRLDDDREKYAIDRSDVFCREKKRLGAMCVVREYEGDKVQIRKIEGAEKIKVFRNNLFLTPMLKYTDIPMEHMYECIKIVTSLPMFVLERPTGCDSSLEQMNMIEDYMISSNIVKAV